MIHSNSLLDMRLCSHFLATSWNGWGMSKGTCTIHSWNDGAEDDEAEPKMGLRVNERLEHDKAFYMSNSRLSQFRRLRSGRPRDGQAADSRG